MNFEMAYDKIKEVSEMIDSNETCEVYKTDDHVITYVDLTEQSLRSFDMADDGKHIFLFDEVSK